MMPVRLLWTYARFRIRELRTRPFTTLTQEASAMRTTFAQRTPGAAPWPVLEDAEPHEDPGPRVRVRIVGAWGVRYEGRRLVPGEELEVPARFAEALRISRRAEILHRGA